MPKPKVSIIIPVNNLENYIRKSLNSVINQTLVDIEIICVDDGSTDNSLKIIKEFAKEDSRIIVVEEKEERGQSFARNIGIKKATGEYIGFVDGDDWIDYHMFEKMYENATSLDSDITMCSTQIFDELTQSIEEDNKYYNLSIFDETFDNKSFSHVDTRDMLLDINVAVWNKIYKSEFLRKSNIKFEEGYIYEDLPFFFETYLKAKKISLVRDFLYFYRVNRVGSTMSNIKRKILDRIDMVVLTYNLFKALPYYEEIKNRIVDWVISDLFHRYTLVNPKYKKEFFFRMKKTFLNLDISNIGQKELETIYYYQEFLFVKSEAYEDCNKRFFGDYIIFKKEKDDLVSKHKEEIYIQSQKYNKERAVEKTRFEQECDVKLNQQKEIFDNELKTQLWQQSNFYEEEIKNKLENQKSWFEKEIEVLKIKHEQECEARLNQQKEVFDNELKTQLWQQSSFYEEEIKNKLESQKNWFESEIDRRIVEVDDWHNKNLEENLKNQKEASLAELELQINRQRENCDNQLFNQKKYYIQELQSQKDYYEKEIDQVKFVLKGVKKLKKLFKKDEIILANKRPKVSVILPVYNVDKYLRQALDSLVNQTLKDIEIICVNDGSTDDCANILDEYKAKDSRIKVIHKENAGTGAARNDGLKIATGECIGFVDPDDWVKENMFERLYSKLKELDVDIVMSMPGGFDEQKQVEADFPYFVEANFKKELDNKIFSWREISPFSYPMCVWNKIYKKELFDKNNIDFAEGLDFEDHKVIFKSLLTAEKIFFVREKLYIYRFNRVGSILSDNDNRLIDHLKIFDIVEDILKETNTFKELRNDFITYKIHNLLYYYGMIKEEYKHDYYSKMINSVKETNLTEEEIQILYKSYPELENIIQDING